MTNIKEVAKEAGVSIATVSHVINNTRNVSDEARSKVMFAIEKCRYYPNVLARSLVSGKSKTFGLIISDISNPFFPELTKSIEDTAFEYGYDLLLSNTDYNLERTTHYVHKLIGRKVAGVVVMTSEMDESLVKELTRCGVPVVFLDVGEPSAHVSNIKVDYERGIEQAIQHLVGLGHRDIAYISGPKDLRSSKGRLEAFQKKIKKLFPDTPERIYQGNFKVEGGRFAASQILADKHNGLPTAVVTANDLTAIGAIVEFQNANLQIPDDISIVGFDDINFAALTNPPLTTVNLPRDEIGRQTIKLLIDTLKNPNADGFEITISTNLVIRNSTAPAKR